MAYGYGRGGGGRGRGGGRGGGRGLWPGNGPFRHLPPWERPGWLYGRGSCWSLGYQTGYAPVNIPEGTADNLQALQNQKNLLEQQLKSLQEAIAGIEKRLSEVEEEQ